MMQRISLQNQYKVVKTSEWWQEIGKDMTSFFGKNCYWIFWKYPRINIERAWHIAQKENNKDLKHLLNNIIKG